MFTDFAGLGRLEAEARERSPEATREAARQFEAVFVQMMLKSMREAGAVLAEDRDTTYEEMFDQQISLELTRDKGIGLAELLVRQLGGSPEEAPIDQTPLSIRRATADDVQTGVTPAEDAATPAPDRTLPQAGLTDEGHRSDFRPESPEEFLAEIWPLANAAADDLGVDPRAVAAQATLETGWGQKLIRDADGVSGNNLFGIKADRRWDGDRVQVPTLEYAGGVARREHAQFRAYSDLAEGFRDYVDFLKTNPRYGDALSGSGSASEFLTSLQTAGYATDPKYANKIERIMASPRFTETLAQLKDGATAPKIL